MKYEYDLNPEQFEVLKDDLKILVCNNCQKQTLYYVYRKKDLYCVCLNLIGVSKGSKIRPINSKNLVLDEKEPNVQEIKITV